MTLGDADEEVGQVTQGPLSHAERSECFNKRNGKPLTVFKQGRNIIRFVSFLNLPGRYRETVLGNERKDVRALVRGLCPSPGSSLWCLGSGCWQWTSEQWREVRTVQKVIGLARLNNCPII